MTQTPEQRSNTQMPKWLLYGLVAKGVIVIAITVAVLYYADVF